MAHSALLLAASAVGLASAKVFDLPVYVEDGYKLVDLNIGTPAASYRLLFDTGSASTWFVDETCARDCPHQDDWDRPGYDIRKSSTGKYTGQDASIDYLGGRVAGLTVQDSFRSGCSSWNGTFIAANESNWFALPADGFLGLAFGSIADGGATPLFEDMMAQGVVDEPKFGIYYSSEDGDDTGGKPGKGLVTLGGSREADYVEGEMATVDLLTKNGDYDVWRTVLFSSTGKTGSNETNKVDYGWSDVVFDTGASSIALPSGTIEQAYESIGMNWTAIISGKHIPLCSEFTDAWSISFEIGFDGNRKTITVTGDQLARPGFAERDDACWPPFDESGQYGFALFGTRLLRNFYTVWDYGNFPQDGFIKPTLSFGNLKR